MRKTRLLALLVLGIGAASGFAQTEPWPPNVVVSPQNPGTSSVITLTISDTWSTDCVPQGVVSAGVQGQSIYIVVGQVAYFTCNPRATFWQEQCSLGPLAAGCYEVYVGHGGEHGGTIQLTRPYAKAATFCVNGDGTASGSCLPRPAHDSGWIDMPKTGIAPFATLLTHNLGGDVNDYVVDIQRRDSGPGATKNLTNQGIGNTFFYSELTATTLKLNGPISPKSVTISLRVRIWTTNCDTPCLVDFGPYEPLDQALSPSTIWAGQILTMTFGVANNGTEAIAPGWRIRYFASQDADIRDDDYMLYETTADFGIDAGARLNLWEAFTFPNTVPAGQYYVGWIFDPLNEICESNETNNAGCMCATGDRLTVTGGPK